MSTPLRGLLPARDVDADESMQPHHRAAPAQPTNTVPVSGLVGQQPIAGRDASVIRRMRFTRSQLAAVTKLSTIAALAQQKGLIEES